MTSVTAILLTKSAKTSSVNLMINVPMHTHATRPRGNVSPRRLAKTPQSVLMDGPVTRVVEPVLSPWEQDVVTKTLTALVGSSSNGVISASKSVAHDKNSAHLVSKMTSVVTQQTTASPINSTHKVDVNSVVANVSKVSSVHLASNVKTSPT